MVWTQVLKNLLGFHPYIMITIVIKHYNYIAWRGQIKYKCLEKYAHVYPVWQQYYINLCAFDINFCTIDRKDFTINFTI